MEKTLNVEEMVKEYTSTTNKVAREKFLEKIQSQEYLSYSAKMVYANRIIESTSWDATGTKMEVNSPIRYMLYVYTLINVYTNVEMHNESMLAEYDALTAAGLKDQIIQKIPEAERKEFDAVLKMVADDFYANHFETHAYIHGLIDRLGNVVENFFSPISEELVKGLNNLNTDELAEAITGAVASMGKGKE